ncbi:MAG: HIT family hydrolase [Candidatus Hecatellales archaeon]|nr:MAG: HIT family hydrolase [Candidatus Hecatellales archaeon]
MKHLWAPWRINYILLKKEKKERGCIFCRFSKDKKNDEKNFVVFRAEKNFVVLNNYPYNNGHLMVAPYRHIKNLEDMSMEELNEHFLIVRKSVEVLKKVYNPHGFNIGINLGKTAGAGVENHIHTHIVPRWLGDTNFMPVISDTKVIPEALTETYRKLKEAWSKK